LRIYLCTKRYQCILAYQYIFYLCTILKLILNPYESHDSGKQENRMLVEFAIQRELKYRKIVAAFHSCPNNKFTKEVISYPIIMLYYLQKCSSKPSISHIMCPLFFFPILSIHMFLFSFMVCNEVHVSYKFNKNPKAYCWS